MKKIFPAEIFEHTAIAYHMKVQVKSQVIYTTILLSVIAALAALPFIYVDVSVQSSGALQGNIERHVVSAPVSGRIVKYDLRENRKVAAGEVLLEVAATGLDAQQGFQESRRNELQQYLHDLQNLVAGRGSVLTPQYVASQQQYNARLAEANNRLQKAQGDMKRNEPLYKERVIAAVEYEKVELEYKQALAALELIKRDQIASWESEARTFRNELKDLQSKKVQLEQDRQSHTVIAPVRGTLQEVTPLQPGSFVFSNQKLGDIIPDTGLIALLYISPKDIGLIKEKQRVKMRIDAFNYTEWGFVTGQVMEVPADVTLPGEGQAPYFRVKCRLDQTSLQLSNGYRGNLSMGMTLQASMIVTRRSLYQLLYDKMDDWLNPHRQPAQQG